jgi:hypothetical protein
MAIRRTMAEAKTAIEIALFSENDPELTQLAEMTKNGDSRIDVSR